MGPQSKADWQLPEGVSRGLWDYLQDAGIARRYDASIAHSLLCHNDVNFVQEQCPEPGRLLDLGCGTGRLLIPLAKEGHSVMGVDLSREMLKVAREKADQEQVDVSLIHLNLTELRCLADQSFDYCACLFSTLGMVQGTEMRRRVCEEACRVLRPGGRFILHVHNRWHNLWNRSGRAWLLRNSFGALLGKTTAGDCEMPPHQGIGRLTLHLFTKREAVSLLRSTGFALEKVLPLSVRGDGFLKHVWWWGKLRAYGYLIAARRLDPTV